MPEVAELDVPNFFLFGDSHAGTLMRAARTLGVDFAGGSIMSGSQMNDIFFKVRRERFIMTSALGRERLQTRLSDAGLGGNMLDLDMPIISTVGFNALSFSNSFWDEGFSISHVPPRRRISMACFGAVVEASRKGPREFYRLLAQEQKKDVYAVLSPRRPLPEKRDIFDAFDAVMTGMVTAFGVKIIDVTAETTGSDGLLLPEFASTADHVHGNDAFGEIVLRKFAQMHASA
jgi:hypothetical protein